MLQVETMKHAIRTRGLREEEWVEKFSEKFAELYDHTDIEDRFEDVHDTNPELLYEWIQNSLENMIASPEQPV